MEEFFTNDYVVRVETGHPGYINYKLIATPEAWQVLASQLISAVQRAERNNNSQQNGSGETLLAQKYATVSRGKSSRVSISFYAAQDLAAHHTRPTGWRKFWNNVSCWLMLLIILVVIYLAGVGASTLIADLIKAP
jgi:hypothetical protein